MNNSLERFLELDAGRALGDLTPEEEAEWKGLYEEHAQHPEENFPLDDLVVAVRSAMSGSSKDPMPDELKAAVIDDARSRERTVKITPASSSKQHWFAHPAVGWAVAACFAVALLIRNNNGAGGPVSNPTSLAGAVDEDSAAIRLQFSRLETSHGDLSGEVVWSDQLQQGYMKLTGLTPNDPANQQFQLWIFDPERDKNPVDGGVFDISGAGTVIIPIDAKLEVNQPNAFAITVEQPGGVVVSERETLLALAK